MSNTQKHPNPVHKIKAVFDLDGVIINKPPLIPKKLLEKLFRGRSKGDTLHYRFPQTKLEIIIRKISHFYLFRPPINANIGYIRELSLDPRYELYIVSARYSFLEKETHRWLKKRGIHHLFKAIHLNLQDEQPHLFKEKTLKSINPDFFIDDDHLLADYLVESKTPGKIYCLPGRRGSICQKAIFITSLKTL